MWHEKHVSLEACHLLEQVVFELICRYNCMKAILIGTTMTLFPIFDIPVFWPILLLYWLVLLFITMRRQIRHMIKYRYIPFSTGKKVCFEVLCSMNIITPDYVANSCCGFAAI